MQDETPFKGSWKVEDDREAVAAAESAATGEFERFKAKLKYESSVRHVLHLRSLGRTARIEAGISRAPRCK